MLAEITHNQIAATDAPFDDMLDALVHKASLGDRRAIGALAVGLGPTLLKVAREALGARRSDEDEDLVQDMFARPGQAPLRPRSRPRPRVAPRAAFGDRLVEEARATLGGRGWFEAEQVVKDFEEELLEGAERVVGLEDDGDADADEEGEE